MKNQNPSSEKKVRLPTTKRAPVNQLPRFRLTGRDKEIIKVVYTHRALTTHQIEALFFTPKTGPTQPANTSRCKYRLQMLFHHGFLYRDEQPQKLTEGRKPLVYFLDERGKGLLEELLDEEIDWNPEHNDVSHPFLDHLLATNDVRVSIEVAARNQGWTIETWLDDKTLKSRQMKDYVMIKGPRGGEQRAAVVPDGYFHLWDGEYHYHLFLEVDRRTVTGEASKWEKRDWARKVRAYLAYYRSGKYQKRYQTKSLRILTVTTGKVRLANLKAITKKTGGKARFWFTTFDLATPDTILTKPIWQQASKDGLYSLTW